MGDIPNYDQYLLNRLNALKASSIQFNSSKYASFMVPRYTLIAQAEPRHSSKSPRENQLQNQTSQLVYVVCAMALCHPHQAQNHLAPRLHQQ